MSRAIVCSAGRAEDSDDIEIRIAGGRCYRVLAADVPWMLAGYPAILYASDPAAADPAGDVEASVVLRLVYGSQSFLLAGDAEQAAEGWMIASGRPLASRTLKVGHHRGAMATSTGFVAGTVTISKGPTQAAVSVCSASGPEGRRKKRGIEVVQEPDDDVDPTFVVLIGVPFRRRSASPLQRHKR